MTRKYIGYIVVAALCVLASACNDDIFTEVIELPEVTDITIEGDGGEWSAPVSKKGLTGIYIDYNVHEKEYVRYFNDKGNETDADCPASELGSIVYENPRTWYSIGFSGSMIYISSNYNATPYTAFTIRLDYETGESRFINVTLTEGEPLEFVFSAPESDLKIEENIEHQTRVASMTNNSSRTQKMEIMPFLESRCSDIVMPAEYWAQGLRADLLMLTFNGRDWVWRDYKDIELGKRREFTPSQYFDKKISVEIPPYSKAIVTYTLHYSRASQDDVMTFNNPVADRTFDVPVTYSSVYATSYEYTVEYE